MVLRLKLLVNKETKKVVFAEAGKEFVDFLMGLMEIPLGSILRFLKENATDTKNSVSLEKFYESIHNLDSTYFQKSDLKGSILYPNFTSGTKVKQAPVLSKMIQPRSYSGFSVYGSYSSNSSNREEVDGYVKGAATYMVMDDLTISPSSTISSINLFNIYGIKDMSFLREMIVEVDGKKALELVRTAFQSSSVLTDVFISKDGSIAATTKAESARV